MSFDGGLQCKVLWQVNQLDRCNGHLFRIVDWDGFCDLAGKKSQRIEWECWEKKCYVGDPVSISLNGSVHGPESGENIPQHFSIAVDDIGWNEKDRKSWPSKTKKIPFRTGAERHPGTLISFHRNWVTEKKKVHSAFLSDFDQKYTQIIVGVLFTFLPLSHPAGSSREGN